MKKYRNKYRISSARLQNWDYGWPGAYFITICTHNWKNYFGEIIDKKIELSNIGVIADILWCEIKNHAKNIELGEFVVMPNHIHGILVLNNDGIVETLHAIETLHATSLPIKNEFMSSISPKNNTISSIIRSYKSAVTKHCHRLGYDFKWQTRFYDHIIRNEKSFDKITNYIIHNPENWENDKFMEKNVDIRVM